MQDEKESYVILNSLMDGLGKAMIPPPPPKDLSTENLNIFLDSISKVFKNQKAKQRIALYLILLHLARGRGWIVYTKKSFSPY